MKMIEMKNPVRMWDERWTCMCGGDVLRIERTGDGRRRLHVDPDSRFGRAVMGSGDNHVHFTLDGDRGRFVGSLESLKFETNHGLQVNIVDDSQFTREHLLWRDDPGYCLVQDGFGEA